MPLYDILNEFQKGGSHMAAVTKVENKESHGKRKGNQMLQETPTISEADVETGLLEDDSLERMSSKNVEEEEAEFDDVNVGEVIGIDPVTSVPSSNVSFLILLIQVTPNGKL